MEKNRNIAAEIVHFQSELHDIESDIKKTQRSLKRVKRSMFCPPGEGMRLDAPFAGKEVLEGQLGDLKIRKAECEERLRELCEEENNNDKETKACSCNCDS